MIYDCFLFNNELDILKIRCEEMKGLNVTHVLVESPYTFFGLEKPLYYFNNIELFKEYNIVHIVANIMNGNKNKLDNEITQRDEILKGLINCKDDDIVIISDVDEVPSYNAIKKYEIGMGFSALRMDKYCYYLNCMEGSQTWDLAKIMPFSYLKDKLPNDIRSSISANKLWGGGWHWSLLGGINNLKERYPNIEEEKLLYKLSTGQSLHEEKYFEFISIDKYYPKYVQENQDKYKELIKDFSLLKDLGGYIDNLTRSFDIIGASLYQIIGCNKKFIDDLNNLYKKEIILNTNYLCIIKANGYIINFVNNNL